MFFFLIIRTPPGSTLTDPLFPYTTLFRSDAPLSSTKANNMTTPGKELLFLALGGSGEIGMNANLYGCDGKWIMADLGVTFGSHDYPGIDKIGRAHVCTPVTNAHLVCRILLEKKNKTKTAAQELIATV